MEGWRQIKPQLEEYIENMEQKEFSRVIIDSYCRFKYASFFIKGFMDVIGKDKIVYQSKPFEGLNVQSTRLTHDLYMACILVRGEDACRIIIDYHDNGNIDRVAYEWCDLYFKVNLDKELCSNLKKLHPTAPNFSIRVYGSWECLWHAVINYIQSYSRSKVDAKSFLGSYYRSNQRKTIEEYEHPIATNDNYVFSLSTLWPHDNCVRLSNPLRATFFRACKSHPDLQFEGGFYVPSGYMNHPQCKEYTDVTVDYPYSQNDYLMKTKMSVFVFNTPVVFNCHGWKLGEYLAMGKAIISTPLHYSLPHPLTHGENIHFVNGKDELVEAVSLLLTDKCYRKKLECGAHEYYLNYVQPRKCVADMMNCSLVYSSLRG